MTMSLNTLPHIPLNVTQYSPDGSSITSSNSSKPTIFDFSNIPQQQSFMQTDTFQPNMKHTPQQQPVVNAPYQDCDVEPLPIGFNDNNNYNICLANSSLSSLYGMSGMSGMSGMRYTLGFDDNTNNNNNNNNTNNNNAFDNTNDTYTTDPFSSNPFGSNNNLNSNTINPSGFSCNNNNMNQMNSFNTASSIETPPSYSYTNIGITDPNFVSFAPGRPKSGAASQIRIRCDTSNINHTYNNDNPAAQFANIQVQSLSPPQSQPQPQAPSPQQQSTSGGEYVYNSNGDIIGIIQPNSNVIQTQTGQCVMRPVSPPMNNQQVQLPPPIINVVNNNKGCNFTVMEINKDQSNHNHHHNGVNISPADNKDNIKHIKTITRQTMKRGRHISDTEKPFVCETCGKGYKYLCNYRSHCKIHTDDAFVCKYCNKRFGRKSNYKEHVRIHTGEAPYKCKYCTRTFKQHHGWKDHLRVHTGEKPYLCKICGKRFTVGHNLNVHMRIHTGERPYQCDICKKAYRQKSAYNSHIKNVHGIKIQRKVKAISAMNLMK